MNKLLGLVIFGCTVTSSVALADSSLRVVYPPTNHQTTAEKIFFLGTAPADGQVFINGKPITRSQSGHFAPSLPLKLGENLFTVRHHNQERQIKVTRLSTQPDIPQGLAFVKDSLTPAVDIARLPGELICFSAIAASRATVSVNLANQTFALTPQPTQAQLPSNLAALTGQNQPGNQSTVVRYEGCTTAQQPDSPSSGNTLTYGNNIISGAVIPDSGKNMDLGKPEFQIRINGQTITQPGTGKIEILSPTQLPVVEVTADSGVARTGPSTDYSRLTPLPKGTRASVTGKEGEWLRLDYGAWIKSQETQILPGAMRPSTIIRSFGYRQKANTTEVIFPLQVPVPVSVQQGNNSFTLTLYNTTAQTDIIRTDDNPLISRLDWQQLPTPAGESQRSQYIFHLKQAQQWGYKLRYEGTSLILTLRHPPVIGHKKRKPLSGIKILLDPGHGGKESGASGPTGYLEKDVNLVVSKLLRNELVKRGATVVMTREDDRELSLVERQAIISQEQPAISLSIHYNSLPDDGDAEKTKGFGTFWYNPQSHSLALFLHDHIVKKLNKPAYGVFWNNLALTRPTIAPSVLLELGFMSNPEEFEQVVNPEEQKKMAKALAEGISQWFKAVR